MSVRTWLQRPISTPDISTRLLLVIAVLQLVFCVGLTIILSNDPNWARWHISYLGEGGAFSATFFNVSMWVGGALVGWFGWSLYRQLRQRKAQSRRSMNHKPRVILAGLVAIAICIYMVGLFPRDFGVLPHDIFGHAIYFIFLALCVSAPWTLPGMPRWFYVVSYLFHAAMLILFVLYWTGVSESLYVAEVATFVFFISWASMLLVRVEKG